MTPKEIYDFRHGFKTALVLADTYGREMEKHGRSDLAGIMQNFVAMSEKVLTELILRVGEDSPSSSIMLEAVQDVLRAEYDHH